MISIINSERAENVLKSAKDLVQSLDEADVAQQKAKDAIRQANEDISLARSDLEKVFSINFIIIFHMNLNKRKITNENMNI